MKKKPPVQLEFALRDETLLSRELEERIGTPVMVTLTDNASTVMSMRRNRADGSLTLRLHHMFLYATGTVVAALAAWIKRPRCKRSGAVIDAFIRENRHMVRRVAKPVRDLRTSGAVYDLRQMYEELNSAHFEGAVAAAITWGKRPAPRRRRSIRFGSYSRDENLIRLHPYLDQDFVPEFFVRYVVFHEMLHAYLGIEESESGRRRIHTPQFNRLERRYPDYEKADAWQRNPANLRRLLR
ncbi:MAG: DUF45 domain-containing protein [Candidatus Hydrogenedentes bacterium]|nr:DUF45 domain-containing protein [Candidatus Hydrogenedentota bacterium]